MGMGQVGMEMAAPIVLGVLADVYLRWSPWGVVTGAVLGLVFGLFQLIRLAGQDDARPPRDQKPEAP
jgi:F0F1-type ATP synthase assembly protein I